MAHAHHHHSHASDITAEDAGRIKSFIESDPSRDAAFATLAEQVLGELAFYTQQSRSRIGQWTMGELDRFVTEYLPSHTGNPLLAKAAPELIVLFAKWLVSSGSVPTCDVPAIEKRMKKVGRG